MKTLNVVTSPFPQMSILTVKSEQDKTIITGYSVEKLEPGDIINDVYTKFRCEVIEEIERRDAKGNWKSDKGKNLWFKAIVKRI